MIWKKKIMKRVLRLTKRYFSEERPLFQFHDFYLEDCSFERGESPLKETHDMHLTNCSFSGKYPIWYSNNIEVSDSKFKATARAGIWYSNNISIKKTTITAPKLFRRCQNVTLEDVEFTNAKETLWSCDGVSLTNVQVKGDYFGMNSKNITANKLHIKGFYCFDGCENVTIRNAYLNTKDAFWNCKNVVVYDSYIEGEYIGWNSKNITFINCSIVSLQGLCYIENLVIKNCRFYDTTLAFEYSTVNATIDGGIESIFNPKSGYIKADYIEELIMQPDKIDPTETEIVCDCIYEQPDRPNFRKDL